MTVTQNVEVGTRPVFVGVGDVPQMSVSNVGGTTVYYGPESVTVAGAVGSVGVGATEIVEAGQFFVCGAKAALLVRPTAGDSLTAVALQQPLTEKGQPNGYAGLDATGRVPNLNLPPGIGVRPVVRDYTVPGPIAVGAGVLGMVMPTNYEGLQIVLSVTSSPVGAPVIVDVNRNGTTMFSTQANRPQVNIGARSSIVATPNTTTGLAGDLLTFDLDQVDQAVVETAPTFVSVETSVPGAGITSYNVARAAAAQLGDVAVVGLWSQSATDPMWTPPGGAGWSSAGASFSFNASRVHWFWRIDTGAAGPWTFTAAGSHTLSSVQVFTWRGAHQTTPIDSYVVGGSSAAATPVPVPALTTVNTNVKELLHVQMSSSQTLAGLDVGYTQHFGFTSFNRHAASIARAVAGAQAGFNLTPGTAVPFQVTRMGIRPAAAAAFTQIAGLAVAVRYLEAQ